MLAAVQPVLEMVAGGRWRVGVAGVSFEASAWTAVAGRGKLDGVVAGREKLDGVVAGRGEGLVQLSSTKPVSPPLYEPLLRHWRMPPVP